MIGSYFTISKYDWKVKVFYNIKKQDIGLCIKELNKLTHKKRFHKECYNTLYTNKTDRAYIYTSYIKHESVIFIGVPSSTGELMDTITHEANHLKSHIATYYDLNEKDEEVCYIIGNIIKKMSKEFISLICDKI